MKVPVRIFLSYAGDDKETALQLADGLRGHSFEVLLPDLDLAPGDNWAARIAKALGRSNAMVVLLSPKSVDSEWVRKEIEYALSLERFQGRLIPVVIGERAAWIHRAPWVLKKLHMVTSPSATRASKQVAEALRKAS